MTPQSTPRSIALSKLLPGDVLLSRGLGDISDLICGVDGGSYSHAALWDGERAIEATLGGVHANPIEHSLLSLRYVDVYRFHRQGSWLGTEGWPAEPVVEQARSFVGGRFAYAELLMAAMVVALGRPTAPAAMKLALSRLGGHAGHYYASKLFPASALGDAKVSTEIVAAAYSGARSTPAQTYALDVRLRGWTDEPAPAGVRARAHAALEADYRDLALQWRLRLRAGAPELADVIERLAQTGEAASRRALGRIGERGLPACCATPRDLETSPSLECMGRLSQGVRYR
jgi:hypothetical protein